MGCIQRVSLTDAFIGIRRGLRSVLLALSVRSCSRFSLLPREVWSWSKARRWSIVAITRGVFSIRASSCSDIIFCQMIEDSFFLSQPLERGAGPGMLTVVPEAFLLVILIR